MMHILLNWEETQNIYSHHRKYPLLSGTAQVTTTNQLPEKLMTWVLVLIFSECVCWFVWVFLLVVWALRAAYGKRECQATIIILTISYHFTARSTQVLNTHFYFIWALSPINNFHTSFLFSSKYLQAYCSFFQGNLYTKLSPPSSYDTFLKIVNWHIF